MKIVILVLLCIPISLVADDVNFVGKIKNYYETESVEKFTALLSARQRKDPKISLLYKRFYSTYEQYRADYDTDVKIKSITYENQAAIVVVKVMPVPKRSNVTLVSRSTGTGDVPQIFVFIKEQGEWLIDNLSEDFTSERFMEKYYMYGQPERPEKGSEGQAERGQPERVKP